MILNLLIKSAWILTNNIVQDRLGHEQFGTFMALYALGFLFLALSDMGINQYTTKTLAGDPGRLREMFPTLFSLKLTFSIVYPFFMVAVGFLLGYERTEVLYLFMLCVMHAVIQINFFFRANFQAFQWFRLDALASVLDRAILLGIVVTLLLTRLTFSGYLLANVFSVVLSMVILYVVLVRKLGFIRPGLDRRRVGALLRASFPFAVITVLYSVNDKVDQVMLERLLGEERGAHETGLYAGAYRWVDAVMMFLWTVLPIFFAKFAHHIRDDEALSRLLKFGQPIVALPMIFAGGFVFLYGEKLLWLFENSTAAELATMERCLRILFIAVVINGFFAIYSTLLTSTNHERFVSWMIFVSILINVTLNFIFIPQYGAEASAWTTVVSFGFLSLTYLLYIRGRVAVRIPVAALLRLLVVSVGFGAAYYGLAQTGWHWLLVTGMAGLVLLGLALGLKVLDVRSLRGE